MLKRLQRFFTKSLRGSFHLRTPDVVERRGERVLHVWGDAAHWSILDTEAAEFLSHLAQTPDLETLLHNHPGWRDRQTEIKTLIDRLSASGIITSGAEPPPDRPLFDGKAAKIENLAINLTNRCNLRCRFCYQQNSLVGEEKPGFTPDQFTRFLRQAERFFGTTPSLTILGGEPLLEQEKLIALLKIALPRGFRPIISTNGLNVTPDFAREANALGLEVQVSLDGPNAALHDAIRGPGTFARTLPGIRTLVASGTRTVLSMVCHEGNLGALTDFYHLAQSLGVQEARFIPLKLAGGAAQSGFAPVPLPNLLRAALELFQAHPEFLPLAGRDALTIFGNTARVSLKRPSCGTGMQTLLIDADGGLYPCLSCLFPQWRFGALTGAAFDFPAWWEHSPLLREFRDRTSVVSPTNACRACPVRFWCLGGCRGETLAVKGTLEANSPFCADLRRAIIDSFWIVTDHPAMVPKRASVC